MFEAATLFKFEAWKPLSGFRQEGPNGSNGGGAVLLVIAGTAHHTFTDVVPYFGAKLAWVTKLVSRILPFLTMVPLLMPPVFS